MSALAQPDIALFVSLWLLATGLWLAHETAPTRRRNREIRRARKNTQGS